MLLLKQAVALETLAWEICKPYSFSSAQAVEIIKLLDADNGSYISSATHRIIKNRKWLIITPIRPNHSQHIIIEENTNTVSFERGVLQMKKVISEEVKIESAAHTAMLDCSEIQFPLLLRKWKQGDYFYPLGMQKKKKLSRFFIDAKLSLTDKERVWVIESNKKIVWVIGYRIDDRFKVQPSTKEVYKITFH